MANPTLTYTQLAERNVSFQLLRTNPKLTTNVKLTIDSGGDLWFNSIDANKQLTSQQYKRFSINENSSHEVNLYKFYNNGKTPSTIAYEAGSTIGKTAIAKDLKDQYDFDLYTSGAKYLSSRQYSEKFTYLAPLYLDQVVPNKFVIFKVNGPSNYTAGQGKDLDGNVKPEDFATDLFKHATIVKVFDMSPTSKIGKYLENIRKNPMFTKNPLYVNYKKDGFSLYRGPSIKTGTYVELPEQLSTVLTRALPLLKVEQFVTQGFERNNVIHPKILNLEFLFNDDTSNPYEFNRYFGFYCNDIDLETFDLDLEAMFNTKAQAIDSIDSSAAISSSVISGGTVKAITVDPLTHKIYIGGTFTSYNGYPANGIVRLNSTGEIDFSFDYGTGFSAATVNTIELDKFGNVYIGGEFTAYNGTAVQNFVKLNTDGSINSTDFYFNFPVNTIHITPNQDIYVGGKFTTYKNNGITTSTVGLVKIDLTGIIDTSFNVGSIGFAGMFGTSSLVKKIHVNDSNKVTVVGDFITYKSTSANGIVQLNPNGSIDTNFIYGTGFNSVTTISDLVVDEIGSVYVSGGFTNYNSTTVNRLIKLTDTGSIDTSFNYQTGANGTISKITLDLNGDFYLGGSFTSYKGVPAKGIARIFSNGELDFSFNTSTGLSPQTVNDIVVHDESHIYVAGGFNKFQEISTGGLLNLANIGTDNDQVLPTTYKSSDDISFALTNPTGVKFRGMNLTQDLSDLANNRTSKDTLFFPYLKTKEGQLHLINSEDWNQSGSTVTFKIDDTSFDLGLTFGPNELVTQETATVSTIDSKSTVSIEIVSKPSHLDTIRIYHPSGSILNPLDQNGKYDELVFTRGYLPLATPYTLAYSAGVSTNYINGDIDLDLIAKAISDISDQLQNTSISGVTLNNTAFLQSNRYGDAYGELKVKIIPVSSSSIFVKLNNSFTTNIVYADGGFLNKSHAIIDIGNISKLTPLLSDIVIKTDQNWSSISRLCNVTDLIKNGLSESDRALAISNFNNKATIQLTDDESVNVKYGKIEIRKVFRPKVGVLSIFETMDFNFSTYSSDYSRNLLLDLYKDFYIPAGAKVLDFTKYTYKAIGTGSISINGTVYGPTDLAASGERNLIWQNTPNISYFENIDGDVILAYGNKLPLTTLDPLNTTFSDRLDIPYVDESDDALDYIGPFSLKADHSTAALSSVTYPYREKFVSGNLSSEYHAYLENFITDFATDGRVIPYINKWGIADSSDSRDNPYRLNSDILFGKDNFGPSHRDTSPTPEKMTHEWFYIESDFGYTGDIKSIRNNYSYFNESLEINQLISDQTYFEKYFTYVPEVDSTQIARPQYRYSILNKNQFNKQYETLFKGAMLRFYELAQDGSTIANTSRFEDYKFSILLKPVKEDATVNRQPIKYRVIENTNSKSITIVIELTIGHKGQISPVLFNSEWSLAANSEFAISLATNSTINVSLLNDTFTYAAPHKFTTGQRVKHVLTSGSLVGGLTDLTNYYVIVVDANSFKLCNTLADVFNNNPINLTSIPLSGSSSFTPVDDVINQRNLFTGALLDNPVNYKIDKTIYASSLTNYNSLISGSSIIAADLGETIRVVYGNSSTILATFGSDVYTSVRNSIIETGDKLGTRVFAKVDQSSTVSLTSGVYIGVKIQAVFEDSWIYDTSSAAAGTFQADDDPVGATVTQLLLANVSSTAGQDLAGYYQFNDGGAINQSVILDQLLPALPRVTLVYARGATYQECVFDVTALNSSVGGVYDMAVTYVSGDLSGASYQEQVLIKADWSIPVENEEFSVIHKVPYLDSAMGDYRISFNENGVSNLTHSFLYYAKDKKYNSKKTAYSTIKLSRGVDLSANGLQLNPITLVAERIQTSLLPGLESYDSLADSEINRISNDFAPIYVTKPGTRGVLLKLAAGVSVTTTALGDSALTIDGVDGALQDVVNITNVGGQTYTIIPLPTGIGDLNRYDYLSNLVPNETSAYWLEDVNHFQIFGGPKYFEKVFENISFAKFSQLTEKSQGVISWESYTDGVLNPYKTMSIEVVTADEITKSTIVKIDPISVNSGQINGIAGFSYSEVPSHEYSVNRYSSEYEVITKPVAGFKYNFSINGNDLTGANICLNPYVDNFFIIKDYEFVKYSNSSILELENSQQYSSIYPYIAETPIDRADFSMLASSWDYGYHFDYSNKTDYVKIPGTRRITEDYSFISKLLNVPIEFTIEEFTSVELTNQEFLASSATQANIVYSQFATEVKFKLNVSDLITKHLSNNGLRDQFLKFFKYSDGSPITTDQLFLGQLTFEQYLSQYCSTNLAKLYQISSFEFYELDDRTIENNLVSFEEVQYDLLGDLGYNLIRSVRINNTKSNVIEGSILIKPNTGVKLVPKIKIKFI